MAEDVIAAQAAEQEVDLVALMLSSQLVRR